MKTEKATAEIYMANEIQELKTSRKKARRTSASARWFLGARPINCRHPASAERELYYPVIGSRVDPG